MRPVMNNKGQSVLSEHVMVFFVVVAALVAMTTYVQRSFEARIHDARNFMVDSVMNNSVCDANCFAATGNQISYEYEPYYSETFSDVQQNQKVVKGATQGNAQVLGVIYYNTINEETNTNSTSNQLPPECAGASQPSYCANLEL
jgi:hypothetical protein